MNISTGKIKSARKVVIYGPEGIGKSTFASKFPNPLFTDTEGSTKDLNVRRLDRPLSEQMVLEQIAFVKANPTVCKTYVIDTADWLEKLCIQSVCARLKISGIEEIGYGKGYVYVNEDFGKILNQLEDLVDLGINVVVTAHAAMRKFEQPDELGAYDRWELKLDKRNAPMLKEWADEVFFVNYKTVVEKTKDNKYKASGGKRVMYTQHHSCWDAKNRLGLPEEVNFDYSVIAPFILADSDSADAPAPQTTEIDRLVDAEQPKAEEPKPVIDVTGIPKNLAELMQASGITEEEIRLVVSQKGYFPFEAKVKDYGDDFINGWVIACWDNIVKAVWCNRDLPFS